MKYFYYLFVIIILILFFKKLSTNLREGLIVGTIFTLFTLGALPWHIVPVPSIAFGTKLLLIFFSLIYFLAKHIKNRGIVKVHFNIYVKLLFLFWIIMMIFISISPDKHAGIEKGVSFFMHVLLPITILSIYAPFSEEENRLVFITIIIGALLTSFQVYSFGDISMRRFDIGQSSLNVSRSIGMGIVLLIPIIFDSIKQREIKNTILFLIASFVLLFSIFQVGARGPVIAVVFTSFCIFLFNYPSFKQKIAIIVFFLFVTAIVNYAINILEVGRLQAVLQSRTADYFYSIFSNKSIVYSKGDGIRLFYFETAWNIFKNTSILGIGTGGFGYVVGRTGVYPHNIYLETLAELGIIGGSVILIILILSFRRYIRIMGEPKYNAYEKSIMNLWLFAFLNSNVSGDLSKNLLWTTLAMLWLVTDKKERNKGEDSFISV